MTASELTTGRLPSLYRPDPDQPASPLVAVLAAIGAAVDRADLDVALTLQAHWFGTADLVALDPYRHRLLELFTDPPPTADLLAATATIRDLARIGSLLGLPPWPDALPKESVEGYRQRIRRTVDLYERGVGTVDAIRRMVETQLPRDEALGPEQADLGFSVEETPPLQPAGADPVGVAPPATGEAAALVGPLMHWQLTNDGLSPAPPTVYVEGVPAGGGVDPTRNPVLQRYSRPAAAALSGLGLGYRGTVPAGQALRLRPAYSSYLGIGTGVSRADAVPTPERDADPTAVGPWQPSRTGEASTGTVVALARTDDHWLWALDLDDAGAGQVRRFDGRSWTAVGDPVPDALTLAADGAAVLIGTATGLLRRPAPGETDDLTPVPVAGVAAGVRALRRTGDGLLIGTSEGLQVLDPSGAVSRRGPGVVPATRTPVTAIDVEPSGTLYLGGPLGVFQFQPALGHWYVLLGGQPDELTDDWAPFDPATGPLPGEADVYLPAVTAVHRGPGADLWLGTEAGLARYRARSAGRLAYSAVVEAFPDVCPDPVHAIMADARDGIWFGTGRGLFRFDGRDFWHLVDGAFVQLGRADTRYSTPTVQNPRGRYRFDRAAAAWQRLDDGDGPLPDGSWPADNDAARSSEAPAVHSMTVVDAVVADLLIGYDRTDQSFTAATAVAAADLVARFAPRPDLIVDGGIPALPRLPVGTSTWRYLQLEDGAPVPTGRPTWTTEGRRLSPVAGADLLPDPARFDLDVPPPSSEFDAAVFAFSPAARVQIRWLTRQPLAVVVRLRTREPGGTVDPTVLSRLAGSIERVRPAGVRVLLAVNEDLALVVDGGA